MGGRRGAGVKCGEKEGLRVVEKEREGEWAEIRTGGSRGRGSEEEGGVRGMGFDDECVLALSQGVWVSLGGGEGLWR